MQLFCLDPATGVITPREEAEAFPPSSSSVFSSWEDAEAARLRILGITPQVEGTPEEVAFCEALGAAARGGMAKASADFPMYLEDQVSVLLHRPAQTFLAERLSSSLSPRLERRLARVLAWCVQQQAEGARETSMRYFHRELEGVLTTNHARALVQEAIAEGITPSAGDLIATGADLWLYRSSPYHEVAKQQVFREPPAFEGYTPKEEREAHRYENSSVVASMKVRLEDLPRGVLAFDVETDTERGMGLRPTKTQITEVVVASALTSWVFAGDEAFILQAFADLLNAQEEEVLLVGWNNHAFDDVLLQTRAELHGISSWRGHLSPTPNHTSYSAASPSGDTYSLTWTTPEGLRLSTRDVFQEKAFLDRAQGHPYTQGLKPFVETLGCRPVKVDRRRLHELTEAERMEYVLSDGIATLRAFAEVERLRG